MSLLYFVHGKKLLGIRFLREETAKNIARQAATKRGFATKERKNRRE
jgi:hypothetical protein